MEVFDNLDCGIFTDDNVYPNAVAGTKYFYLIATALVSLVGKEKNHDDYDTKMTVNCATSFISYILQKKRSKTIPCFWILPSLL